MSPARRLFGRLLLAALFAAAGVRLLGFAARFGRESLQADFSAFYTAGQAARFGLSPYRTHPDHDPPVSQGTSRCDLDANVLGRRANTGSTRAASSAAGTAVKMPAPIPRAAALTTARGVRGAPETERRK